MKINKHNYEAYFLDYHEGNLTPQQVADLLLFVAQHPELEKEFKSFECFTLDNSSSVVFENKEELKKHLSPTLTNNPSTSKKGKNAITADTLIASLEGLLIKEEALRLGQQLLIDPSLKKEYERYQQTKLIADSSIVFENKEVLKHAGNKRKSAPLYYYFSVAASILVLIGFFFLSNNNNEKTLTTNIKAEGIKNKNLKDERIEEQKTLASFYPPSHKKKSKKKKKSIITSQIKQPTVSGNEEEILTGIEKESVKKKLDTIRQIEIDNQQITINKNLTDQIQTTKSIPHSEDYLLMGELAAIKIKEKTLDKKSFAAEKENGRLKKFSAWDFAQIITKGISKISGRAIEVKPTYNDEGDVTAYALGLGGFEISRAR